MKARIHTTVTRRHFTSEVGERADTNVDNRMMLHDVDPSACNAILITVTYTITSLYVQPTAFLLATTPLDATKTRSRIEAESQSNRNCNSRFTGDVAVGLAWILQDRIRQ